MLQKFGEHMLRNFFWGAPVACKIKWGGPGQPPGLPMLMTTTAEVESIQKYTYLTLKMLVTKKFYLSKLLK